MVDIKGKAPIIVLIILIIISLGFAGLTFYYLQKEYAKNTALQTELEDIKSKYNISESKLRESEKNRSEVEAKLNEAAVKIDLLQGDLNKAADEKNTALSKVSGLESLLDQQKKLRGELENKLIEVQNESKKIKDQINAMESQKTDLETKIKTLEEKARQGVELGKIIVGSEAQNAAAEPQPVVSEPQHGKKEQIKKEEQKTDKPVIPAIKVTKESKTKAVSPLLEGKVLVLNKEYDFAVIDLGTKDGVGIDNIFSVYHNNKYIGDLKVEKVHDSMAAAGFLSPKIKDQINEGDRVVQKKK